MRRRPLIIQLVAITVIAFGSMAAAIATKTHPQLGLDLQGGASVTLQPVGDFDPDALDVVPDIYRDRIDSLGVAEPEIIRQGDTIVVNLPGVKDKDRAIELIGVTGKVLFRPVLARVPLAEPLDMSSLDTQSGTTTTLAGGSTTTVGAAETSATATTIATDATATTVATDATATTVATDATATTAATDATATTVAGETTTTVAGDATTTTEPVDPASLITPNEEDVPEASVVLPDREGTQIFQLGPAFATGETAISSSGTRLYQGEWQVELELNGGEGGLDTWNEWAAKCYNREPECAEGGMAIVLDHRVISAPVPQTSYFDSSTVTISGGVGGFPERDAKDLSKILSYGSTPVEMKAQAVQTVSATLGQGSLQAAIVAGIIGIVLVLIFLLAYYRSLALVVVGGLVITAALMWSIVSMLSRTSGLALTIAGVTGIIVSIGVTVDSYVVFFERLKDEVVSGKTFRSSAQRGFKASWRTIVAANTASLIGALVLWYLSVGAVRGFAFFLALSTAVDLVVAYFYTRPVVLLLSRTERYRGNRTFGVTTDRPAAVGGVA